MRCTMMATILGACPLALAGPLEVGLIPDDADWVVHVDMERVAHSKLMGSLPCALEMNDAMEHIHEVGINPDEDVYSLTVYGWDKLENEHGVLIMDGSEKLSTALWDMAKKHELTIEDEQGRTYFTAQEDDEPLVFRLTEHGDGTRVVVAHNRDEVDAAAARHGGHAKVIGDGPSEGSLVFVSALNIGELLPENHSEPHSTLVKAAEGLLIELSEHDDRIAGRMQMAIADTERTRDIAQMLQGVLAFGRMAMRDNEDLKPLAELASNVLISEENSQIKVAFDVPIDLVCSVLEEHCKGDDDE